MRTSESEPIDVDDPADCVRWCERLGIDAVRLRAIVEVVGTMPAAVKSYLHAKGGPPREVTDTMRAAFAVKTAARIARRRK